MEAILPSKALTKIFVGVKEPNKAKKQDTSIVSYHAFKISDIGILIPQETISEVAESLEYCHLPNTNNILFGMANLRGNIIPIFDLHELFGIPVKDDEKRKVLVIGRNENAVAVMINELPKRISIAQDQRLNNLPPIPETLKTYTKACYQENGIWLDIDHNSFFDSISGYLQ